MKTTALLCDHAAVSSDGKLYINGANINRLITNQAEPPLVYNFALAVIVEIPWNDTNRMHQLTVELVYEGGERGAHQVAIPGFEDGTISAQFNAGRSPDMVPGEATLMPIAFPFYGLLLANPGGYSFKLSIDNVEVAHVPFQARVLGPLGMAA